MEIERKEESLAERTKREVREMDGCGLSTERIGEENFIIFICWKRPGHEGPCESYKFAGFRKHNERMYKDMITSNFEVENEDA